MNEEYEGVNEQEVAEPVLEDTTQQDTNVDTQEKQPQSAEENARYAAARREAEAQTHAIQTRMDEFARSRGFESFDEMEEANREEMSETKRQEYIAEHGIDPEAITPLINQAVEQHPVVQRAKMTEMENFAREQIQELKTAFPDAQINQLDDIANLESGQEILELWQKGVPLKRAYAACAYEEIASKRSAAAAQKTRNDIASKAHLESVTGRGEPVEEIDVPEETKKWYRGLFPKWDDKKIAKDYAKRRKR